MSSTYIHTQHDAGKSKFILKALAILYIVFLGAAVAYIWLFTQDRYVSQGSFKVSRQEGSAVEAGFLELALPGMSDSGSEDSQVTIGFVKSADLLLSLEEEFNLVDHYHSPERDVIFRLKKEDSLENRLEYYRDRILMHYDKESGLIMLSVDTFDPELSQRVAASLLGRAEVFVNILNQSVADQQMEFVRGEVDRAEKKVSGLNRKLLEIQNKYKFISPKEEISSRLAAVQEMKMEHLRTEAELTTLLRDSPESPRIETLRSRLNSLSVLIDGQTEKLSGPERDRLNQILMDYKELELKLEFANRLRMGAETLLEKTRVDAAARSRFFSVIQNPYLPEDATLPRRGYSTASILFLGVLLFLFLRALAHSVFERG